MPRIRLNIHDVSRIEVSSDTSIDEDGAPFSFQNFRFVDAQGAEIGRVLVFLSHPEAALSIADQPLYCGLGLAKSFAAQIDEG